MQKKKLTLILLLLVFLFAPVISQSLLFSVHTGNADNVVTFGSVSVQVIENTINAAKQEVPFTDTGSFNLAYDSEPNRIIYVKNNGEHPIFVRAKLGICGTTSDGTSFILPEHYVNYNINEKLWKKDDADGWYYYTGNTNGILQPGMTTEALMDKIVFDINELKSEYYDSELTLTIYVSAVQSANNGGTVYDAGGWPKGGV